MAENMTIKEELTPLLERHHLNIYDLAVMTEDGIRHEYFQKCNACNNSYSVTKLLLNTVIGIMADRRMLDPRDKLMDILRPQITFDRDVRWDQVTVHHALNHTMGIEKGMFDVDVDDTESYGTKDYLSYILSYPPVFQPGSRRVYSDAAHYLLSRAVSQITGRAADEMFRTEAANPLDLGPIAWFRCPLNHTVGGTGAYARASDLVKVGWLYLNYGEYWGKRILSEEWVRRTETEGYDLYPVGTDDFRAKRGMYGQMLMFSRKRRMAVAWLGCNESRADQPLIDYFCSRPE